MFKVVKRTEAPPRRALAYRAGAVVVAIAASAFIMLLLGYNPAELYAKIIEGALTSSHRLRQTIHKTIPLVVLSLGVAIAFKMKFWNIGAEGQFYMGAYAASYVALFCPGLPRGVLLPAMVLAGLVAGGLWALIAAVLKLRFNTSETLVTLMLNYIANMWVTYLQYGPWKDPAAIGFPRVANFNKSAVLPSVLGVHIGWLIALLLVVAVHVLLKYSKLGYEVAVLGESETTARYAGMNVFRITVLAVFISGALCGLAGTIQASAIEQSLNDQMSGGLGFTAVITTWLARLSAPGIVLVSFLFAVLLQGGAYLQSAMKIPASVAEVLQAVIIFFVLASEFFIEYKIVRTGGERGQA